MVGDLVRELGVHVHRVEYERPAPQCIVEQDVVERLRVPFEHVAVALVERQRVHQVGQHAALQDRDRVRPLEVVQVAVDDDFRARVCRLDLRDEVVLDLRLLVPLYLGDSRRRLEAAHQRVVAALRVEVVGDHEQVVAVEHELGGQRLAARIPRAVAGVDAARAVQELRAGAGADDSICRRRVAARAVDERHAAVGPEQEDLPDIASRLATVLVVDRVDLSIRVRRSARGLNRGRQLPERHVGGNHAVVGRPAVVLHLLAADDVRRFEVVDEDRRQPVELRLRIAGRQVLEVERGDGDLVLAGRRRRLGGDAVVDRADPEVRHLEEEVPEVVVEHSDERRVVVVADVHVREGRDHVVGDHTLRVPVVRPQEEAATRRAKGGVGAVVADDGCLAERVRRADGNRVVERDAHAFQGLPVVEPVAPGIEHPARLDVPGRVVLDHRVGRSGNDRRGKGVAGREQRGRRRRDLGRRQVPGRRAAGPELLNLAADLEAAADVRHRRRR